MTLSETARYALRAVIALAQREGLGPVPVAEVAETLGVPRNYLSKILHRLAQAGVLRSRRGPSGGFALAVPADRLLLAQVVDPVDPVPTARNCLLGRPECSDEHPCAAHGQWCDLAEAIRSFFKETTVADLIESELTSPSGAHSHRE